MAIRHIPALAAGFLALSATAADRPITFSFDPQPRWSEEAATDLVCEAIVQECPGLLRDGEIETEFGYAELYNADGYLVGLRSVKSTGCRPLDEHMLLSQRQFRTTLSEPGKPDLDEFTVETAAGVDRDGVLIVKSSQTTLGMGC